MIFGCPGSSKFKQPAPENVKCPSCGGEVEIWTDEIERACPRCKNKVTREGGQSCLDWCKYAKECIGEERYNKYLKNKKAKT
jgi:hypothetical protein